MKSQFLQRRTPIKQRRTQPEKAIEIDILKYLNSMPKVFAWKDTQAGYYDKATGRMRKRNHPFAISGVADILCSFKGQFVAFEVKVPGNHPTDKQREFLKRCQDSDGKSAIVYSLEDAIAALKIWGLLASGEDKIVT